MPDTQQIEVTETKVETGTTKFGIGQLGKDNTPKWATIVFRIFFYVSNFAGAVLAMETKIDATTLVEIYKYIFIANMGVHGLSKMFGVDTSTAEADAKEAFNYKRTN